MASESLSQNEIDLLFSGGVSEEPERPPVHEVQIYDFRRPARISKERNRSLLAMYGLMAKSVEGWITGRVRDQVEVELQSVEQLTFGEFVLALPSPCASYVVDVSDTGQQGVIDFGHELAYFLVDRLLGGVGMHAVPERPLTPLERLVVRIAADRVAAQLTDCWKDYVRLDLGVTGFESIPEMLRVANREDPVLVANLLVGTEDMSSLVMLCLPFTTVEKFFTGTHSRRAEKAQGSAEERRHDRETLETTFRDSRLTVEVRWPTFHMPLHKLAAIKPGDVFQTEISPETPVEVLVSGQRRFVGVPGRVGRKLGVRVTESAQPEPDILIGTGRD